jgi:phosphoenolpyruvate synthase/pyruvate phosphate dikinase
MEKGNKSHYSRAGDEPDGASASSARAFSLIGTGGMGGKAQGLARLESILDSRFDRSAFPSVAVDIPWFRVIGTDCFDLFMEKNRLYDIALSDTRDRHMATAFQRAELPADLVEELRELISAVHVPLAIRSSSLLEDTLSEPFAGVYATKMLPNNQFSTEARLRTLVEAVKFVYTSTFSREAKSYRQAMGRQHADEKMAVRARVTFIRWGTRGPRTVL